MDSVQPPCRTSFLAGNRTAGTGPGLYIKNETAVGGNNRSRQQIDKDHVRPGRSQSGMGPEVSSRVPAVSDDTTGDASGLGDSARAKPNT
jgi:hypothetical protein